MTPDFSLTPRGYQPTLAEQWLQLHAINPGRMDAWRINGTQVLENFGVRQDFIRKFGFAVLDRPTVERLRPYAPFLEVGAGSGYWTYELQQAGIDAIATDPGTGSYRNVEVGWQPYCAVERLTALEALARYPARSLLIVWPDFDASWAAEALAAFSGGYVAYVGEGDGGATADDCFHEQLTRLELVESSAIPKFFGIHDRLAVYQIKEDL